MKLGHALILMLVIVLGLGLWTRVVVDGKSEKEIVPDSSLLAEVANLQKQNDSLKLQTKIRDTVIHEKVKIIYKNAGTVYGLPADTALLLFAKWTEELQDSGFRNGYIRLSSGSSNQ